MIAGAPRGPLTVPAAVQRVARRAAIRAVWQNEIGDITFELTDPSGERRFVKWALPDSPAELAREADRLRWAAPYTPVPTVLDLGSDDTGSWLVTRAMNGASAVDPRWATDPKTAVTAIGEGLRSLHEALPAASCPFSWTAEHRVAAVHRRADAGRLQVQNWDPAHRHLTIEAALNLLATPPPPDTVVCHGDSCAPNTMLGHDGRWCGHVDLGDLGLADRWADLAIAAWSTQWNFGPGWEPLLLRAYGTSADPDRIQYYRLLWDLSE